MARRWLQHTTQGQRHWPEQQSAAVAEAREQQREANRLKSAGGSEELGGAVVVAFCGGRGGLRDGGRHGSRLQGLQIVAGA